MNVTFPGNSFSADGQAAWVLVCGLIDVLRAKRMLTDDELLKVIAHAEKKNPSRPIERDEEVKQMLAALRTGI